MIAIRSIFLTCNALCQGGLLTLLDVPLSICYPSGRRWQRRGPKPGEQRNLDLRIGRESASRHDDCQHQGGRGPAVRGAETGTQLESMTSCVPVSTSCRCVRANGHSHDVDRAAHLDLDRTGYLGDVDASVGHTCHDKPGGGNQSNGRSIDGTELSVHSRAGVHGVPRWCAILQRGEQTPPQAPFKQSHLCEDPWYRSSGNARHAR